MVFGLSTRAVHGTRVIDGVGEPVVAPVFQSSTFVNPIGDHGEVRYTRYGNNPNQVELGNRVAALEGGESAIAVSSGMGATALALRAVLNPGDHLLSSAWIYGTTRNLFESEFGRLGIEVSYVNPGNPRNWRAGVKPNTRAVFVETVTNPLMRVIDLGILSRLCRELGSALIVDSTFCSPYNCRPLEHGADVVIHSATKYLNGHSDVIAGCVVGTEPLIGEVRRLMKLWGQAIDPHAAWLVERGLKSLAIRMERHNANGMAFATWAATHPQVASVHYPGLPDHPDHEVASRLLDGYGGMVGITLVGGGPAVAEMFKRLTVATHAPSLGGVETLVSEPRYTSHAAFSREEREAQGIPDGFVRISLGIEDVDDIIADFEQAFAAVEA